MNYVNHYSEEFKLKVVHEVLRGEISKEVLPGKDSSLSPEQLFI